MQIRIYLQTILVLLVMAAFAPQSYAAQATSSGSGSMSYSCDSKTGQCSCSSFMECQKMKKKACKKAIDGGIFGCTTGTSNCKCDWKQSVSKRSFQKITPTTSGKTQKAAPAAKPTTKTYNFQKLKAPSAAKTQ